MQATLLRSAPAGPDRFILLHVLLIPCAFALAGLAAHSSGLDNTVSGVFYDAGTRMFPARGWPLLETVGHQVAKTAVYAVWFALIAGAVAAKFVRPLGVYRRLLWTTVAAMALGPLLVIVLKDVNAYRCPWDLQAFGGVAPYASGWFVPALEAGRCFPSGHAAGGFSFVALYFAAMALGRRRLRNAALCLALSAGTAFSLVRIVQGAHFLSHNLWSAAIDWCSAAVVFLPLLASRCAAGAATRVAGPTASTQRRDRIANDEAAQGWSPPGLRRLPAAVRASFAGLATAWRNEASFRQELALAAILVPIALLLPLSVLEHLALAGSIVLVLIVELLNTAIENVVDLVEPQFHPLAAAAKDAGSAAVLLALGLAAMIWIAVLWPAG